MGYDAKGLGIAEMTFLAVNYPSIFEVVRGLLGTPQQALRLARAAIAAHNAGMISNTQEGL